jgi:hypothetical protein
VPSPFVSVHCLKFPGVTVVSLYSTSSSSFPLSFSVSFAICLSSLLLSCTLILSLSLSLSLSAPLHLEIFKDDSFSEEVPFASCFDQNTQVLLHLPTLQAFNCFSFIGTHSI